jgi:hypothetical protein
MPAMIPIVACDLGFLECANEALDFGKSPILGAFSFDGYCAHRFSCFYFRSGRACGERGR